MATGHEQHERTRRDRWVPIGGRRTLGRRGPARTFRRWGGDPGDPVGEILDRMADEREREETGGEEVEDE